MCLAKFSRALDGRSNYGIKYLSLMLLQRVMPLNFTSLQIQVDKGEPIVMAATRG